MSRTPVRCGFCCSSQETRETGPLLRQGSVVAHNMCMLFSSGIVTKESPRSSLAGFLEDDVRKEMNRGKRLRCFRCKKNGATVGCEVPKCKRSYHYLCALKDGAKKVEDDNEGIFKIYCVQHLEYEETKADSLPESTQDSEAEYMEDEDEDVTDDSEDEVRSKTKRKKPSTVLRSASKKNRTENANNSSSRDDELRGKGGSDSSEFELVSEEREGAINPRNDTANRRLSYTEEDPESESLQTGTKGTHADVSRGKEKTENKPCFKASSPTPKSGTVSQETKPGFSGNPASFWRKCREAGCVEKIFSELILAMTAVSEKISTDQADDEENAFSLKILQASGMLSRILEEKDNEFKERLEKLQRERDKQQDHILYIIVSACV
ncbi:PHD finger protein 11 isoform X2 [Amia ocellicauda]|uniref:PHD finger protein 11 isoform X2 n=1 Tax=Amia ocellicauda TaxID=2972642 RepID=UPI003464C0D0